MYRTQIYDSNKAEAILWRIAKMHHKKLSIWICDSKSNLIAYVIAEPFEHVNGFKNLSFAEKVIIGRDSRGLCGGYHVYQV